MRIFVLLCVLLANLALAKTTELKLTLGHNQRVDLTSLPDTLYVEDPSVVDYEIHKNWLLLKTKGVGQTKLYIIDKEGKILHDYLIVVGYPTALLQTIVSNLFSGSKIKFRTIPKHLIVAGSAPSVEVHKKILEQIYANVPKSDVIDQITYPHVAVNSPSRQINLRVRIVEVRRSVSKALGIHWDLKDMIDPSNPGARFSMQGPRAMNYSNLNTQFGGSVASSTTGNTFASTIKSNLLSVTNMLDLLEDDNFATTVQEPNLTVKAGEAASFSVGGSVPINRAQTNSFNAGTVGYQEYGISLDYTAEFDEDDPTLIKLTVNPSVSSVLPAKLANTNPTILRKQAKTVVELRSGQSIAIAGLVSSETNSNKSATPGLSTIPVIGGAFRSEDYSRLETEVVFVITPYIVHATQNGMLEDPMDNTGMLKSAVDKSGFIVGDANED